MYVDDVLFTWAGGTLRSNDLNSLAGIGSLELEDDYYYYW